jgi:hypothetical protein
MPEQHAPSRPPSWTGHDSGSFAAATAKHVPATFLERCQGKAIWVNCQFDSTTWVTAHTRLTASWLCVFELTDYLPARVQKSRLMLAELQACPHIHSPQRPACHAADVSCVCILLSPWHPVHVSSAQRHGTTVRYAGYLQVGILHCESTASGHPQGLQPGSCHAATGFHRTLL